MAQRKGFSGLIKRGEVWHIDKVIGGKRICESTGESDFDKAFEYLAHKVDQLRQARVYGVRPKRSFTAAATKYLNESWKSSIKRDAQAIEQIKPFIGDYSLDSINMGTLEPFISKRRTEGVKARTINYPL